MTDAALSVTQDRVEQFAKTYLQTCGCQIRSQREEWVVTVPESATTNLFDTGETRLICSSDPERIGEKQALHPESDTFRQLLTEASEKAPTGRIELTATETEILLPDWLVESGVSVASTKFNPYYDRTAILVLFQVSVETVSEYQNELLLSKAIDTGSGKELPRLVDRLLAQTELEVGVFEAEIASIEEQTARSAIDRMGDLVIEEAQSELDEIRGGASRKAGAELEEYRQLQYQRINEAESDLDSVVEQIEDLNDTVEESENQARRMEALQERKELRNRRDELQEELETLQKERNEGFPEKRQEVRDRHSLDVTVRPLTITEVTYEQGELNLEITDDERNTTTRVAYGSGVGVTETVNCDVCGEELSASNPLRLDNGTVCCESCSR